VAPKTDPTPTLYIRKIDWHVFESHCVVQAAWYAQRRKYSDPRPSRRTAFRCNTVESDRESPKRLWRFMVVGGQQL